MRNELIQKLTTFILSKKQDVPLVVGIDGIDASGKTHLGDQIYNHLLLAGYPVIRSTVDNFHHPREMRYQRGMLSPEGYFHDSFNYDLFKEYLLEPLSPGGDRQYRTAQFDHHTNQQTPSPLRTASNDHILICDGIFLFRKELLPYWNVKIFVNISFETSLQRALARDLDLLGSTEEITRRYQQRYIPGQKLYFSDEQPKQYADIIIDNNNYLHPKITFMRA